MAKGPSHSKEPAVPFQLPPSVADLLGADAPLLLDALRAPAPTSIRWNPAKCLPGGGEPVPWCVHGRYLDLRPVFTLDPLLHAGCYYVQEASSMFLEQAVRAAAFEDRPLHALDICAAPGGKSTHLLSLLPKGSLLVCNEVERSRIGALQENVWKWGAPDVVITSSPTTAFEGMSEMFDLILADAPCSGEGMFRKDAFARLQWDQTLVKQCALTQERIVEHAWSALKPGGVLVYSTCTWEHAENEARMAQLITLGGVPIDIPVDPSWGIAPSEHGYRFYPHRTKGEGFFLGAVRKSGRTHALPERSGTWPDVPEEVAPWIVDPKAVAVREEEERLYAISATHTPTVDLLRTTARMISPGTPIAERKGGMWKPHAALALNAILAQGSFPSLDLDRKQALEFLRGETLHGVLAEGTALARFEGRPLGWVHGAGRRWNNGYPKPWRIRMR